VLKEVFSELPINDDVCFGGITGVVRRNDPQMIRPAWLIGLLVHFGASREVQEPAGLGFRAFRRDKSN
jgi:hypothetical protein